MVYLIVHPQIIWIYDSIFLKNAGMVLVMLFYSADPFVFSLSMFV
jgi:hypothetical protein